MENIFRFKKQKNIFMHTQKKKEGKFKKPHVSSACLLLNRLDYKTIHVYHHRVELDHRALNYNKSKHEPKKYEEKNGKKNKQTAPH